MTKTNKKDNVISMLSGFTGEVYSFCLSYLTLSVARAKLLRTDWLFVNEK